MKLWSDSWTNGDSIPARYAAGRVDGRGGVEFSDNLNPHLAWSEVPAGAQSMVLICHDFDVPSRGDDVNKPDREIPADLARVGERFFRVDKSGNVPGTGLGLSIVKELMTLMGGRMEIASQLGRGTTVRLWL